MSPRVVVVVDFLQADSVGHSLTALEEPRRGRQGRYNPVARTPFRLGLMVPINDAAC